MYNINQKIEGKHELFTSKRATEIERFNWERDVDIVSISLWFISWRFEKNKVEASMNPFMKMGRTVFIFSYYPI